MNTPEERISTRSRLTLALYRSALLAAVVLLASACATPIGVTRVDTQEMYRSLTANVLSGDRPSQYSEQLLTRLGLHERFDEDPEVVLAALRGPGEGLSREYLFALSELSFYHAVKSQKPEYFLASAVYAWAFVLARTDEADVDPIDPRLRLAANLYNLGLAQGLEVGKEATVVLESGSRPLPFGQIEISVDEKMLLWSSYRMTRFISLGEFKVRGFLNRYRQAGIGAPLAAELTAAGEGPEAEEARKRIPARLKVPVTAVLNIEDVSTGIATGHLQGTDRGVCGRCDDDDGERRAQRAARARAHGGPGLPARGRAGLGHRDRRVPPCLQAAVPRRAGHDTPLPAGTRAGGARPRHGLERRPVGGHHQRAPERSEAPRAYPVLALHLQHEQPYPALRQRPAAESPEHPHGARSRGARSGARPARGDRPQPGRAADAAHGHRQRHALLGRPHGRAL